MTQDAILYDIDRHNDPRCHLFWHCLAQRPKMLSSTTLLGIATWDVILSVIAWHHNPRCYFPRHCSAQRLEMSSFQILLGTTTQDVSLCNIAQEINLRCYPFRHCLAPQPKISIFVILLEKQLEMSPSWRCLANHPGCRSQQHCSWKMTRDVACTIVFILICLWSVQNRWS